MDVVLNSLAGEFVDASLDLLPRGGRFLEMGKTDIRDPGQVAAEHPGVSYRAFDLVEAGPGAHRRDAAEVIDLFEPARCIALADPEPATCGAPRRPSATCARARHIGKIVLTDPAAARPRTAPS